jgi:hypothetical protein
MGRYVACMGEEWREDFGRKKTTKKIYTYMGE